MNTILVKIHNIEFINNDTRLNTSINFCLKEGKEIYNNDGTFSHVRIDDNISVNISNNEIKYQLKQLIGKNFTIINNGSKIFLSYDFPKEFLYSKSAMSLNKKKKLVKYILIPYLDLIIANLSNKMYSNDHKEKHKRDAKYGFYKYIINISLLIDNIEEFYNITLVIRNSYDKRKYLYDIIGIKKID